MVPYEVRLASVGILLLAASISDILKREVEDYYWYVAVIAGLFMAIIDLPRMVAEGLLTTIILSITLSSLLGFFLYYAGFYGGADGKAIASVSLLLPVYWPKVSFHPLAPLIIFTNGIILSLLLPISFLIYNTFLIALGKDIFEGFECEPKSKKIAACLLGIRHPSSSGKKFWSMMETISQGKKRFVFKVRPLEGKPPDKDDAWITPDLPLILFFFAGFLIMIGFGDILSYFFSLFIK